MTSCLLSSFTASLKRGPLLKEIIRFLGRSLMSKWQNLLEAVSLTHSPKPQRYLYIAQITPCLSGLIKYFLYFKKQYPKRL